MKSTYLFTSKRLGFRTWKETDLDEFYALNSDENVMAHFPFTLSREETKSLIQRLINHQNKYGYTYFATEIIETGEFIGFIGLAYQTYKTDFTPATDIGWRLKKSAWGKGYATEGAKRCLELAFKNLKIDSVIAVCTAQNRNSENVMQKIGMKKKGVFKHPNLTEQPDYEDCIWYRIEK